MRKLTPILLVASLLALLVPSAAAKSPVFHGIVDSAEVTDGECEAPTEFVGSWSVRFLPGDRAVATFVAFDDAGLHAAWGGAAFGTLWEVEPGSDPDTWVISNSAWGLFNLTMSLDSGVFTYSLDDVPVYDGSAYILCDYEITGELT